MINKTDYQELMMKAVDNELTVEEKTQFDQLLANDPSFKKEWQEFSQMKEITSSIRLKAPKAEHWELYWQQIYNRLERGFAWILTSIGAIIILAFLAFQFIGHFLLNEHIPLILRVGLTLLLLGLIVLFVSVLREKLTLRKTDKYKGILR
ncbi:MAG: hypothetical protein KDD94_06360 [Calditrichaeota bacterium]|nr:hypothetical protein [Calditrichota bacterium]